MRCFRATSPCNSGGRCWSRRPARFGARIAAMDAASKNAGKLIGTYTLQLDNRARQAYITKELMEIVSGAEALK